MRAIARHFLAEIGDGVAQFALGLGLDFRDIDAQTFAEKICGLFRHADLADKAAAQNGDIEIIHKHAFVPLIGHVAAIELRAEPIVEMAVDYWADFTSDNVGINGETTVVHRANDRVAARQAHIDFGLVSGLETEAANLHHHEEMTLLGLSMSSATWRKKGTCLATAASRAST